MAGGVKLVAGNIEKFRQRMADFCGQRLTDDMLVPSMKLDGILDLRDCLPEIIAGLEKLAPFGRGNPRPLFLVENVRLNAPPRRVGSTGSHMQLTIEQDGPRGRRAGRCICFKMGDLAPQLPVGTELNLVVEPKIDRWNGREKVDLIVVDLARCDGEPFAVS
jgi:single-stranded-DNA-specific exonuclease